jgi:hypothetical protein
MIWAIEQGIVKTMINHNRQKLQDDLFKMAGAIFESKEFSNEALSTHEIVEALAGAHAYNKAEVEKEIKYLTDSGYFAQIATGYISPTSLAKDKMWGKTSHSREPNSPTINGVFISGRNIKNNGTISGPTVEINTENYSGTGEVSAFSKKDNIISKYWWLFIVPLITIILGYIITEGKMPKVFEKAPTVTSSEVISDESKILDVSIFKLVSETSYQEPILKTEEKWQKLTGLKTKDEYAIVSNYGDAGSGKTWVDFKGINNNGGVLNIVTCIFESKWRQKIQMLERDDKELIFNGTIRGDITPARVPILENCNLKSVATTT